MHSKEYYRDKSEISYINPEEILLVKEDRNFPVRGKVLVVDDDLLTCNMVKEIFTKEGYFVQTLNSPSKIADFLKENRPDIVLLDIVMPEMNGFEVLALIKEKHEDLPVVFLSGRHDVKEKVRGLKAGAEDYIIKPFDFKELLARVELILKRYKRFKEKLIFDPLTGAYSRSYLNERFKEEWARYKRKKITFSLAFLDLDKFKDINDNYGHAAGDYILKSFVSFVLDSLRESDSIYRLGGEEFVILMPDTNEIQAMIALERIRYNLTHRIFDFEQNKLKVFFSAGIVEANENIQQPEEMIRLADKAMYEAKKTGGNKIVIHF